MVAEADEGKCPYNRPLPRLPLSPRGDKHQLAYEAEHDMRPAASDLSPVTDPERCGHVSLGAGPTWFWTQEIYSMLDSGQ